jgi:hydrogenase/urease accessory protein HupE
MNRFRSSATVRLLGIAALFLLCGVRAAEAHLVTTGLGPLYDGIGHFLLSPEDWATVVALALLAGLGGAATSRWVLFGLPLAWLAGGMLGLLTRTPLPAAVTALVLFSVGALVAMDLRLRQNWVATIASVGGFLHGYLNGTTIAPASGASLMLLGVAMCVFILAALVAAVAVSRKIHWQRIGVRVAGSWLAAIGLLLVAWTLRKP